MTDDELACDRDWGAAAPPAEQPPTDPKKMN